MATTPKLNLPLIEANMSADVPRDLNALAQAVDTKVDELVGKMSTVPTVAKDAAGAITELFQNVSDGKTNVAGAITDKGVPTSPSDTFEKMADNIHSIPVGPDTSDATAAAGDLRSGKIAYGKNGARIVGSVPVQTGGNVVPGPSDIVKAAGIYDTAITVKGVAVPAAKVLNDTTIAGTQGTMPNNGALNITPGSSAKNIPPGYTSGGQVAAVANLSAGNVRGGVAVGDVTGTFTNDANAGAADIAAGKTAYVQGNKVTGIAGTYVDISLSAPTEQSRYAITTYIMFKKVTVNVGGPMLVSFALYGVGNGYYTFGRIYKNGVPYGTERNNTNTGYVTYDEVLTFAAGDTIEVWGYTPINQTIKVKDFKVTPAFTVRPSPYNGIVNVD